MSVYDEFAFAERVNFAANYIRNNRTTTRRFDTCFEMHDGDAVATALIRRADADPAGNLARNLFKYIGEERARKAASELGHVKTSDLKHVAAEMQRQARKKFDEMMAARQTS